MYGRLPSKSVPSLLDMPPVNKPMHVRQREHGMQHVAAPSVRHGQLPHHHNSPHLDASERSSILAEHEYRASQLPSPGPVYNEPLQPYKATHTRARSPAMHQLGLLVAPQEHHREEERHIDFSHGKHTIINEDPYIEDDDHYQSDLQVRDSRRMEIERQKRERQREADLQRRAELQRELEMEREELRRRKEDDMEREREIKRRRDLERQRASELQRQQDIEEKREREREIDRDHKRQMEKERERLHLQLEREQRDREIQLQQELIHEREIKIQHETRMRIVNEQREEREHAKEMQQRHQMQMMQEREMAMRNQRMAPQKPIPSLLTMPPMAPPANMKKGLLGDPEGIDNVMMDKVRLQQAMLAQQNKMPGQNQNQNRQQVRSRRGGQRNRSRQQQGANNRSPSAKRGQNQQNQRQKQQNQRPNRNRQKLNNNDNKKQDVKSSDTSKTLPGKSTPPWLKDGTSSEQQDKGNEAKDLYDPLHPTEDEDGNTARKRKHSEGELQVRIHQGKQSRDVLDPPKNKLSKKEANEPFEELLLANIQPADRMVSEMKPKIPATINWVCHVCNVKCADVMNYHQHMVGRKHQMMMNQIMEVAEAKTAQAMQSLKGEHHLARVRHGYKASETRSKGHAHFCSICMMYTFCSKEEHNRSKTHQEALREPEQKCKLCDKTFKSLNAFVNHCNSKAHKHCFEEQQVTQGNQDKIENFLAKDERKKAKRRDNKLFVTLDEVGFGPDAGDKAINKSGEKKNQQPASEKEAERSKDVVIDLTLEETDHKEPSNDKPEKATLPIAPLPPAPEGGIASSTPLKEGPTLNLPTKTPTMSDLSPSTETTDDAIKKDSQPWSMQDLVSYCPNVIVGQEYVIPVTGYFCKLCRKFYNSENSARVIHCKSEAHFNNLKTVFEEMQLAAQLSKKEPSRTPEKKGTRDSTAKGAKNKVKEETKDEKTEKVDSTCGGGAEAEPEIRGETKDGVTETDETMEEKTMEKEAVQKERKEEEQTMESDTREEQTVEDEIKEEEKIEEETKEDETMEKEAVQTERKEEEQTMESDTKEEQTVEDEIKEEEKKEDETMEDETMEDKTIEDETIEDETIEDETMKEKTVEEEEVIDDEAMEEQTVEEKTEPVTRLMRSHKKTE